MSYRQAGSAVPLLVLWQEWLDWENSIWSKYATQAPEKRFASELAAELKWLLQQVCALAFDTSWKALFTQQ